ncbi:glycerate kinase type-2 family protein [Rhodoligotrophos defluvii]|uniref:glycerate kinase type-2 family protein n=1 Tax=Rhodoligotrophos defluvii TaxID=2561934 RepID=UPI0010C998F3|nr:glycerate kinase [Rhodoligotrophos defluvii]
MADDQHELGTADERALLRAMLDAAVKAADPRAVISTHLPKAPAGRTVVVGAGKAAAAMAQALEDHWRGPLEGLVITRYGHGLPTRSIEVVEAAHPVPDAAGHRAAQRILSLAAGLGEDDLLICLISGGGSALMALPADGITLEDKQAVNRALLASGATITEMNCVRKHLSAIKGGRLAQAAWPAPCVSLLISDVPADDPSMVASGPGLADVTTRAEALAVLAKYRIEAPESVLRWLRNPASETPKPGDPQLERSKARIIAAPSMSLAAARTVAEAAGYTVVDLGDRVEGEARDVAFAHADFVRELAAGRVPVRPPAVILSGGETTVALGGAGGGGRGGRNAEYALALAIGLDGLPGTAAIACDTDGIDGSEDNAGAIATPDTLSRARLLGLDPRAALDAHDSYSFFAALGDLVVTGPTHTNVNDFRAVLIKG